MKSFSRSLKGTEERLAHNVLAKVLADTDICKGLYTCSTGRKVAPVGPAVVHPDPGEGGPGPGPGPRGVSKSGGDVLIGSGQPPPIWTTPGDGLVSAVTIKMGID